MSEYKHKIYFLVRSYKSFNYFDRCIDSILRQNESNYTIIFIDDASDYTDNIKNIIRKKLKGHVVIFNKKRKYSLRNAYEAIHKYMEDNAIVINVDGDDWLISDEVIKVITNVYEETGCDLTYGNCRYYCPGQKEHNKTPQEFTHEINQRFPVEVEKSNTYREYHFLPLHLRTWKASLFKSIDKDQFLKTNGEWIRFCEDQAMFYPMLELCNGNYSVIKEVIYNYNVSNLTNDNKIHQSERLLDEIIIRKKHAL